MTLLRYCGIPKLDYLLRTTHPDLIAEAALRFDQCALGTALKALHFAKTSRTALESRPEDGDENKEDGGRMSAVSEEQLLMRITLPISSAGLGLRPTHRTRHAA